MESHKLGLECPTTLNPYILRVDDTSVYSTLINVTCPQLLIQLPGFRRSNEIIPTIDRDSVGNWIPFRGIYTSKDLGLSKKGFCVLPDGIYLLRYSVSPNDLVYVEYSHLRITKALNLLYEQYCDLDICCNSIDKEKKAKLDQLRDIEELLNTAKIKVENCHKEDEGMELYEYAIKLLDKMKCKGRC